MSKWISDAYIKRLLQNNRLLQGNCEYKLWEQEVEKNVDAMPSIDIVRCKECKYYDKFPTWSACTYWSGDPYEQASVNADDFCSYGEREGE